MPNSVTVSLLVLGGVLLLIAILGGNFKIFGAEVGDKVSSTPMRLLAGALGLAFVVLALSQGWTSTQVPIVSAGNSAAPQQPAAQQSATQQASIQQSGTQPLKEAKPFAGTESGIVREQADVFARPNASAQIVCHLQPQDKISLESFSARWYRTECGETPGYIQRSLVKPVQ